MNKEDFQNEAGVFFNLFNLTRQIGASSFSRVYLATEKATGRQVALKIILKINHDPLTIDENNFKELNLNSPHLVKIYDIFEDVNVIMVSMEYIPEGNLFDWICSNGTISESGVSIIIHHLLLGIKTLHDNNIIHRDIKPENILITETELGATIKLADYCFAKTLDTLKQYSKSTLTEVCSSPEILSRGEYGPEVDMWSIGVITYILLCGRRPFEEDQVYTLSQKVSKGDFNFDLPEWENISKEGKMFIKQLLEVDPEKRLTVDQALDHEWLSMDLSDNAVESSLRNFQIVTMGRKLKNVMEATSTATKFSRITEHCQNLE